MRQRHVPSLPRHPKLPPILEVDEDGVPVLEISADAFGHRWSSDEEDPYFQMGDFPAEFDE